jgi:hypothetical protein
MRDTRIRTITKLLVPNRDIHMFINIFHFSFFCGISTLFFITITNLRKVHQKSNIFFIILIFLIYQ